MVVGRRGASVGQLHRLIGTVGFGRGYENERYNKRE
jgi:hypothetical protein